jgi:hypothetical protein
MYKLIKNIQTGETVAVEIVGQNTSFLLDLANTDYQRFLGHINEDGTEIVEGDIPESILADAAQKKFNEQLWQYQSAVARLAQYLVSEGRAEVKEMIPSGEQTFNEETEQYEDVLVETITQTAVDPLQATVEVWEGDEKVTVRNPAIVQDEEERALAQAIVDTTPQEVKDAA